MNEILIGFVKNLANSDKQGSFFAVYRIYFGGIFIHLCRHGCPRLNFSNRPAKYEEIDARNLAR